MTLNVLNILMGFLASLAFSSTIYSQGAASLIGTWATEANKSHIQIYRDVSSQTFQGKIIWLKEPNDKVGKPTKDDQGRPIINMEIMKGFVFDEDEWNDGEIFDPETGKTYFGSIEMIHQDQLKLRGSVDPLGWIGRSQVWHRVK